MSEWEFLWGLTGDDLDFAMSNGYTKEEYQYILANENKKTKILVIFTGGTIGSSVSEGWISADPSTKKLLINNYKQKFKNDVDFVTEEPYTILSENLDAKHLNKLIDEARKAVSQDYDGIIVTHGTDTLQFSCAALSYALGNSTIPVVVVSSNYPLNDERANGNINFEAAVEFIKQNFGKGVFCAYRNNDNRTYYHAGNSLLSHAETDDDVYSINNNFYAEYMNGEIIINKRFVDCRPAEPNLTMLIDKPGILVITPCPAISYNYNSDNCNAVIIKPYHSATLNTDSADFQAFCKEAQSKNIPIYVASVNVITAYESSKLFKSLGLKVIPNTTFTDNYIRIWFEISKNY